MGKRDKKKKKSSGTDPDKKAELQLRKEQKADRAARKRLEKEQKQRSTSGGGVGGGGEAATPKEAKGDGGDDIDSLLSSYRRRDEDMSTPAVETLRGDDRGGGGGGAGGVGSAFFPSPRANFSLTLLPGDNDELLMFGGEYYDGAENVLYDELYRWDPDADAAGSDKEGGGASSEPASQNGSGDAIVGEDHGTTAAWGCGVGSTALPLSPSTCTMRTQRRVLPRCGVHLRW